MNIKQYLSNLASKAFGSGANTKKSLEDASKIFDDCVVDVADLVALHAKDTKLSNIEAVRLNETVLAAFGISTTTIAPVATSGIMRSVGKTCKELSDEFAKLSASDSALINTPKGAYIDRAAAHIAFIGEYYMDMSRYILMHEKNMASGALVAPVFSRKLRRNAPAFASLCRHYSSGKSIKDTVESMPNIKVATDEDIETMDAMYKPGVLDPIFLVTAYTLFFPVRLAVGIRDSYIAKRYKGAVEKRNALKLMLITLSSEEDNPGVIREISHTEARIKSIEMSMHKMEEDSVR